MKKRIYQYESVICLTIILYVFLIVKNITISSPLKTERGVRNTYIEISSVVYEFKNPVTLEDILNIKSRSILVNGSKIDILNDKDGSTKLYISRMNPYKLLTLSIPFNINKASYEEIEAIPYMGPVLTVRILEYRDNNGGFESLDELMDVKGIGYNRYKKINKYFTIE